MNQLGTVEKAMDILFHLHSAPTPRGVTDIGRELEMPKSSVHRLLAALLRRGLVGRDAHGRYQPGVGLVALGLGVLEREPAVVAARPVLDKSAREVGETFFLVGARAGSLVVLEKAEGSGFLRAAPRVGSTVPVHATAVGKLYLAFAPEQIGPWHAAAPETFTPDTIVDPRKIKAVVEAVRLCGLAHNRDEWLPGLSVSAAAVWLAGRMVAAVAVAAASQRFNELGEEMLVERVRSAAQEITERLEGDGVAKC